MIISTSTFKLLDHFINEMEPKVVAYRNLVLTTYLPEKIELKLPIYYSSQRFDEPIKTLNDKPGRFYWRQMLLYANLPSQQWFTSNKFSKHELLLENLKNDFPISSTTHPKLSDERILSTLTLLIYDFLRDFFCYKLHFGKGSHKIAFDKSIENLNRGFLTEYKQPFIGCFLYNFYYAGTKSSLILSKNANIELTTFEDIIRNTPSTISSSSIEGDYLPPSYLLKVKLERNIFPLNMLRGVSISGNSELLLINHILTALRLYKNEYIGRSMITGWIRGNNSFNFGDFEIDKNIEFIKTGHKEVVDEKYVIDEEDITKIEQLINLLLTSINRNAVSLAISRFNLSYARGDNSERLLDLIIALESIFGTEIKHTSEVGYRMRIRAAKYLGKSTEEKNRILSFFRDIYILRSKIVHGSESDLHQFIKKNMKSTLSAVLKETEKQLREAIIKILSSPMKIDAQYFNKLLIED